MGENGRSYFSTTVQILLEYYASLDLHSAKLLKAQSSLSLFAFKDTYFCLRYMNFEDDSELGMSF